MDLQYGPEYEEFRAEVQAFLEGWPLSGEEAKLAPDEQEQLSMIVPQSHYQTDSNGLRRL